MCLFLDNVRCGIYYFASRAHRLNRSIHCMKIRKAGLYDADALAVLLVQLGYTCPPSDIASRIALQSTPGRDVVLVAECDALVRGVLILHIHTPIHVSRKWALISAFVVDEAVRGQGIGAALLKAAEQHALMVGCSQVELSSSESRIRAHAFYEQHGYVEKRKRFVRVYAD